MIIKKTSAGEISGTTTTRVIPLSEALFFDIETTGFSPKTTMVYLIGCTFFNRNTPQTIQWFAETAEDEAVIMQHFFDFASGYRLLVHYNGSGFDIPYLQQKCLIYGLSFDFNRMENLDLYKKFSPYRKILKADSMKQKSLERFLGIHRADPFSGGELIPVYQEYLNRPRQEIAELLMQHNYDDLAGLLGILRITSYCSLFEGNFHIQSYETGKYSDFEGCETSEIVIRLELEHPVPRKAAGHSGPFYFSCSDHVCIIKIKLYDGELKYFYPDYKNYYYLPAEDRAIHKSVALFVDKDYRKKAKASTCYAKKTGIFLPQPLEIITPSYKSDLKDSRIYFELTEPFLQDSDRLKEYIIHILSAIRS